MGYFKTQQIDPALTPEQYVHRYDRLQPTTKMPAQRANAGTGSASQVSPQAATKTLPQTWATCTLITRELMVAATTLVRLEHPTDASLHRALVNAEARLLTQPWAVIDGQLTIASAHIPGEIYHCDDEWCECKTDHRRFWCWHRAGFAILSVIAAGGRMPVAPLPLPDVAQVDETYAPMNVIDIQDYTPADYARIQRAADELFA